MLTKHSLNWFHFTHWGRLMHICIGNLTNIGSDNGLSPGRRQAIIWSRDRSNAGILLMGLIGTNFSEIWIQIEIFSLKNMFDNVVCEIPASLCRPQCVNKLTPRQNGHHFADNAFKHISWKKTLKFLLKFHWILFQTVQFTIFQHWFSNGLAPSR